MTLYKAAVAIISPNCNHARYLCRHGRGQHNFMEAVVQLSIVTSLQKQNLPKYSLFDNTLDKNITQHHICQYSRCVEPDCWRVVVWFPILGSIKYINLSSHPSLTDNGHIKWIQSHPETLISIQVSCLPHNLSADIYNYFCGINSWQAVSRPVIYSLYCW